MSLITLKVVSRNEYNNSISGTFETVYYTIAGVVLRVDFLALEIIQAAFVDQDSVPCHYRSRPIEQLLATPLTLLISGTDFQIRVWQATLEIPAGFMCSYHNIAQAVGSRSAARAVGQALASNRIAYIIPCHRVVGVVEDFGGYKWGLALKKMLLAHEKFL